MSKRNNVEKLERGTPAGKGHNRPLVVEHLKAFIARVEKLEEEKADLTSDIRDVYAEAKGNGFDVKTIRSIVKLRRMDAQEAEEAEQLYDTYRMALGFVGKICNECLNAFEREYHG